MVSPGVFWPVLMDAERATIFAIVRSRGVVHKNLEQMSWKIEGERIGAVSRTSIQHGRSNTWHTMTCLSEFTFATGSSKLARQFNLKCWVAQKEYLFSTALAGNEVINLGLAAKFSRAPYNFTPLPRRKK